MGFDLSLFACVQKFLQTALEDLDTFKDESVMRLAEMYRTERKQPTVEDENRSVVEPSDPNGPVVLLLYY